MSRGFTPEQQVEFRRNLPRQRMVASLVACHDGRLLIVKPTYRDGWLLPGGVIDQDESPAAGCVREAQEELGLRLTLTGLVMVDHASDPGDGSGGSVHYWFTTDELTAAQVEAIRLPADELEAYRFVQAEDALSLLIPRLQRRLRTYLPHAGAGRSVYAEDGVAVHVVG